LQLEAQGLLPERVIVLETVGTVGDFVRAVRNVPGLEWLAEVEEEDIPPDEDFFVVSNVDVPRPGRLLGGRLFMIFADQAALSQMLSLWTSWQAEQQMPHGLAPWASLFEQLRDVRTWGIRDRLLETGVLHDWQERIAHGQEVVPCELELWYRQNTEKRDVAERRVRQLIEGQNGQTLASAVISEIAYHALLVHLPIRAVSTLPERLGAAATLVQCDQIQFFRASGQMAAVLREDGREQDEAILPDLTAMREPVIALLDGLPVQVHRRLEGHLIVDDPDDLENNYLAGERRHGTAMASLIVHGDLGANEDVLPTPLYVRPILQPDARDWRQPRAEAAPENTLVVDLLYRAVRRLFEGEGTEPPAAPTVAVINLSVGIRDRFFEGALSPLARLLDWLAWRYQVLFVVSAGNHAHAVALAEDAVSNFADLDLIDLQGHVVRAVAADARHRRLLSPAEATNVLTVGALDADASNGVPPPRWRRPYTDARLPSPLNAQGMGWRRAIKPDILAPGGRVVVQEIPTAPSTLQLYDRTLGPGQLTAAPGTTSGDRGATWFTRGTSNSTAFVSRAAGFLHEVLQVLRDEPGGALLDDVSPAVWLKALIAHGATWGPAGSVLSEILRNDENGGHFKEYLTRLMGYGGVDIARVAECTPFRVTMISGGSLRADQSHIHQLPLPPSLSGVRGHRRLTVTLAWFTPVNPRHQGWRRAQLWFHADPTRNTRSTDPFTKLRLARQEADWKAVQRGTLQHEIFEGEKAAAYVSGTAQEIQVSCRADAGALEEDVPYALVTTLEVAEEIGVEIYDEIRVAVDSARVQIAPSS
jgi:hypothetical protein